MNKQKPITDWVEVTYKLKEAMVVCADSVRRIEEDQLFTMLENLNHTRTLLDEVRDVVERHIEDNK